MNKTLLLSAAMFLLTVFFIGIPGSASAQTADATSTLNNTYADYLNLFAPYSNSLSDITSMTASGLQVTGGAVTTSPGSSDTTTVKGFALDIGLVFSTTQQNEQWHWDRISTSSNNFVIRACETSGALNCWINSIPYATSGTKKADNIVRLIDTTSTWAKIGSGVDAVLSSGASLITDTSKLRVVPAQEVLMKAFTGDTGEIYHYDASNKKWIDLGSGSSIIPIPFQPGENLTIDAWYLANSTDGEKGNTAYNDYQAANANNDAVRIFPNVGNGTYFRIGTPITVTVPSDTATAVAQNSAATSAIANTNAASSATNSLDGNLPKCGIVDGTINGCLAQGAYYIYFATAWIAGIFGKLFDFFIGYSLSDSSYRYSFAVTGWKLVRDISNLFFIIIMVWTGFSAVFGLGKTSMKSVIPNLIVNALLINFSLFATRVVIDISNVTARIFYSQMVVCDQANIDPSTGTCSPAQAKRGLGGYWPLSEKIVSSFNPQKLFSPAVLHDTTADSSGSITTVDFDSTKAGVIPPSGRDYSIYFGIICLVAAFIMIAVAIMFFKVTFLFLGRVVGLYICIIFSPFAFLSRDMPLLGGVTRLKWKDWLGELTNYALLAPVFVFFLYIIYAFLSSDFVQQIGVADTTGSFFGIALSVIIPMLIIYFMMGAAQKAAESLSGDIGKGIQKLGGTVTGLALGAATGGAALVGASTIGRAANKISNSEGFRDWAARNGRFGRATLRSVNSVGKASFDARNTTIGKGAASQFGLNFDQKQLATVGLGTKSTKGGYVQTQENKIKEQEEYKKLLVTKKSDDEIKASYSEDKLKKRYEYDSEMDTNLREKFGGSTITDNQWKDIKEGKNEGKKKKADYDKMKKAYLKTNIPPAVYLTAAERNEARTNAYATYMEKKSGGPFATQDYYRKDGTIYARKGDVMRNPYADEPVFNSPQDAKNNVNAINKGTKIAEKNASQVFKEMGEGFLEGAVAGGTIGTIVPGVGNLVGAGTGGVLNAIRRGFNYSGTTNKAIAKKLSAEPKKRDKLLNDLLENIDAETGGGTPPPAAGGSNSGGTPPPTTP